MNVIAPETRAVWSTAADPGELFILLWQLAGEWEAADRAILPRPALPTRHKLASAVLFDDAKAAVATILQVMEGDWPSGDSHAERLIGAGLVFESMRAIEEVFTSLHPRTRVVAPAYGPVSTSPFWLDEAERKRHRSGSYSERGERRLIPNGPFSRHARGRDAASANSLQDHFPILTVAPSVSREQDRAIAIDMKVIGTDAMRGVPASRSIGRERIRFIPLAEAQNDLKLAVNSRAGQPVLDVRPTVDMASRLIAALQCGADVDIAFAPELTVPASSEGELQAAITALAALAPRIILAGTGLTVEKGVCGRSWNEARIFARGGRLLWRQRKIWPFGMQQNAALRIGLTDPGVGGTLMEDIAGNSRLEVVDMDGFGRCLVLICQDIEANPVVEEVVARYQPDWIFVPVLDPGVKIPGWAHQRAVALSKKSQARFLIGSSLTLSRRLITAEPEPAIGLAVGPANPTPGPDGAAVASRAVALVCAAAGASPRTGLLVWDHTAPTWQRSTVDVE